MATINLSLTKGEAMTLDDLMKKASLYEIAKLLKISAPATYKWKKSGKIPAKRVKQLMLIKPDWFE